MKFDYILICSYLPFYIDSVPVSINDFQLAAQWITEAFMVNLTVVCDYEYCPRTALSNSKGG